MNKEKLGFNSFNKSDIEYRFQDLKSGISSNVRDMIDPTIRMVMDAANAADLDIEAALKLVIIKQNERIEELNKKLIQAQATSFSLQITDDYEE